jgi:PDDEXK-like domain of unknown function (DUF3799)
VITHGEGCYFLTAEQYHADPAHVPSLSSSIAHILLEQSPLHAWLAHPRLNPNYAADTDSRFDLGSAAHLMLLERRSDRIVRVDADDWRTKAAKEMREAAQAQGQYAVLERQYGDLERMCSVAREFVAASELGDILETGDAEQTLIWTENGVNYRCRPDMMSKDRVVILDYKSTASAAPEAVGRQIGRMGYDLQAQFYSRGVEIVTGQLHATFVFLFQEITPPYACSLMSLSNAYRAIGQDKVARATRLWQECLRSNQWPGYRNEIHYVEPKPWDLSQFEDTL